MVVAEDILDEYSETRRNSKFFVPVVILCSVFVAFLILDMFIYIETLTWHGLDADFLNILSAVVPASSLAFFIGKKKMGWLITTIFYAFIVFAGIAAIFFIPESGEFTSQFTRARPIFILTVTTTLFILLQTRSIRLDFKISNALWLFAILISSCCAFSLVLLG